LTPLLIHTDSEHVKKGLTERLKTWEDQGWIGVANAEYFQAAAYRMRIRSATVTFNWVKGHAGIEGNEGADKKAEEGAGKNTPDVIDLSVPPEWKITGAKLSATTQAIAYRGVRKALEATPDKRTGPKRQLDLARDALEAYTGQRETDEALWKGITSDDIRKNIQTFLYRTYQNSYKTGDFWFNTNDPEKAKCSTCQDPVESLAHILCDCESDARKTIWKLAQDIWPHGPETWPDTSLGIILACGNLAVEKDRPGAPDNPQPKRNKGATRLLRILISESAHLIWVLRCERAIAGKTHSHEQIIRRWTNKINDRLNIDRNIAHKILRLPSAYDRAHRTWKGTLNNESSLPEDWAAKNEVLVGIRPPRSPI
ncbi:hypothetical protein FA95DRAFT_1671746, partial [Auriscalpium vulgare]